MDAILGLSKVFRAATIFAGVLIVMTALWAQRPFRELTPVEYDKYPLPKDYREPGEWAFARLMYPPVGRYYGGFQFLGTWKEGASNWAMDYPRSDRHFSAAVRRLTNIGARSAEQLVDLDDRDVFDWPWLYGVEVGHWDLTDEQAKTMREYLLRGGFFMCDDFHGAIEWDVFAASMKKVFPDRPIVELDSEGPDLPRRSTISISATRSPARYTSRPASRTKRARAARRRTGAASTTIAGA